jgi:ABC-type branched-subunit amino acid transport system substrate-binding protein
MHRAVGGTSMKSRWARIFAVLTLVALVAAACGSDRDDDEAGGTDDTTEDTSGGGGEDATFGDLDSPCGEGDGGAASDTGVTADSIKIGYGDDAGFASSPGLNHEMADAIKAMIAWCNDQGGINGRTIEGNYYDAKITEVNNAMTQACNDAIFMMVGQGWALDAAQEQTRLGCELPSFPTYTVSPEFANAPLMYAAVPNPVDFQPISEANYFAKKYPKEAKKVGIMFANFSATVDTKDKSLSTWPKVGIEFLDCQLEYNITGEPDYKPFVQKLKDCGAEAVEFIGSPFPIFQNLLDAANQLEFEPYWLLQANFYDQSFAKWNKEGLADKVIVRLQDVPFEYASKNKATKDYIEIVEASGGDLSDLGLHAASAFLLWATQADACGDELTRQCVLDKAKDVHDWDGGGLSGPADVGNNMPSACEVVVGLEGTKWVQLAPEEPGEFDCDEDNVQQVTGQVVDKVDLDDKRIVTKFAR